MLRRLFVCVEVTCEQTGRVLCAQARHIGGEAPGVGLLLDVAQTEAADGFLAPSGFIVTSQQSAVVLIEFFGLVGALGKSDKMNIGIFVEKFVEECHLQGQIRDLFYICSDQEFTNVTRWFKFSRFRCMWCNITIMLNNIPVVGS